MVDLQTPSNSKSRAMVKKKLPAEARKVQLFHCAIKTFARSNYRVARITDIALEAGVSEAIIYRHFSSKKAIYLDMLKKISGDILHHCQDAAAKGKDEIEALRNIGIASYDFSKTHADASKVYFQAISEMDDADIADRLREDHQRFTDFIYQVVQKGIEGGVIKKDVDIDAVSALLSGRGRIITIVEILSLDKQFHKEKTLKMIDYTVEMLRPDPSG